MTLKGKLYFDRIVIKIELVQIERCLGKWSACTWQIDSSFSKITLHLLAYGERNWETHGKTEPFSQLEEFACRKAYLVWHTRDNKIQNAYENSSACHTWKLSQTVCSCVRPESSRHSYTEETNLKEDLGIILWSSKIVCLWVDINS